MLKLALAGTAGLVLLSSCYYYGPYPPSRGPHARTSPYGPVAPYQQQRPGAENPRSGPQAPYQQQGARQQPGPTQPSQPAPAPAPTQRPEHPVAKTTANPDQVLSPYPPYNVIDVSGFKSGQLARDPSNGKIFRIP